MANKAWDGIPYVAGDCVASVSEWNEMISWIKRVVVLTAINYAPTIFEVVLVNAVGGERTIALPAVHENGHIIDVKKIDASMNNVIVDGNGGDTIDGDLTQTLFAQWESIQMISDGSNWYII